MKAWLWKLRGALDAVGWQGTVGIALIVTSAVFAAAALKSRLADLQAAQEEVETLRARLLLAGPEGGPRGGSRDSQLANFYAFFPPLSTLPDWLERIYAAAEKNGVRLETGEYKLLQERGARLARYQLTLPVKGDYARVRGFIAGVLANVPAAALEEVAFRRDAVGSTALDVRIRFTLYMGPA